MAKQERPLKDKQLKALVEQQLHDDAEAFAEEHGGNLSGLIRWFLRKLTAGEYPMSPEDVEQLRQESKRPSRKPKE